MNSGALLAALIMAATAPTRLPPIDQCSDDPSFRNFRSELEQTVRRQDSARLLKLVDDNVQVDLGGNGFGKIAFTAAWALDKPQQSEIWEEIGTLLRLGCIRGEGGHLMPSLFEQIAPEQMLETYVAVVPGSPLRSRPAAGAPAVATLYWDVLSLEEVMDDRKWWRVRLADGRRGYVRDVEARNPLDYRMLVGKMSGKWRIRALVAGD